MHYEMHMTESDVTVAMSGELSFTDHGTFRKIITTVTESERPSCVFDVSKLERTDSAGLGMLMIAQEAATEGGWSLSLRNAQGEFLKMLKLTKFDTVLSID